MRHLLYDIHLLKIWSLLLPFWDKAKEKNSRILFLSYLLLLRLPILGKGLDVYKRQHIYGYQWRSWPDYNGGFIDQISEAIETIKHNPDSRRIIVSAWNVADLNNMNLPPCHAFFQFYVANGRLSLQLYQRSADTFLGVPFTIASYALLLQMVAQVTGLQTGDFVHTLGDTHIYTNHLEQVKLQLSREPRPLPQMKINPDIKDIFSFKYEDFELVNYDPWPDVYKRQ